MVLPSFTNMITLNLLHIEVLKHCLRCAKFCTYCETSRLGGKFSYRYSYLCTVYKTTDWLISEHGGTLSNVYMWLHWQFYSKVFTVTKLVTCQLQGLSRVVSNTMSS